MKRSGLKPPSVGTARVGPPRCAFGSTASSRAKATNERPSVAKPATVSRPVTRAAARGATRNISSSTVNGKPAIARKPPESTQVKPKSERVLPTPDLGEFKPLASVDLNSLCRVNTGGLSRMSVRNTDFLDPVQRKAFIEMRNQEDKRYSVDFSKSAQCPTSAGRSTLTTKKLDRTAQEGRVVKFAENPTFCRISEEGKASTPTSTKSFLERVKNTPSVLRTPLLSRRPAPAPPSSGRGEEEESPPEPTPSKQSKLERRPAAEVDCVLDLMAQFLGKFRALSVAQLDELRQALDEGTVTRLQDCVRMLSSH